MKLMIVDDHEGVRRLIRLLLVAPGDSAIECSSADEAVRAADDFRPDCITMDVRMPGLCSFEAIRAILEKQAGVCVIMVTSYDKADLRKAALDAGAAGYVVKDDLAVLPCIVSSLLSSKNN